MKLEEKIKAYWEAFDSHNIKDVLTFIDEDVIVYFPTNPTKPIQGKENLGKVWSMVFEKVIPNQRVKVISEVIQNNIVATQLIESGTVNIPPDVEAAMNIVPAKRNYEIPMASFIRFNSKGLIQEINSYWDTGAFSQQIGIDINIIRSMQSGAHA